MRLSSIYKKIEVAYHILSNWVVLMLDTNYQLPRLLQSNLKYNETCVVVVFLTDNNITSTKVV